VTAAGQAAGRSGLLEQLMAIVRPEFRTEVCIPAPDDPVFAAGQCAVAGCDRTTAQRGLCNAHAIRWRQRGRPDLREFGLLLTVLVTAAGVQDRDAARPLLWNLRKAFPQDQAGLGRRRLRRQARHLGQDQATARTDGADRQTA
jgi:hypothetical protein